VFLRKVINFVSYKILSPFKWDRLKFLLTGRFFDLKPRDREFARTLMEQGFYLWVTRRETHLTTYLIGLADYYLKLMAWHCEITKSRVKPTRGFYAHAFINVDGDQIIEAVSKGVSLSYFDEAFDVDAAAALVPANIPAEEWAVLGPQVAAEAQRQIGKLYDSVFKIDDEAEVSCIELVRLALKKVVPEYQTRFAHFEETLQTYKNITPQMLYDSESFVVVWEVRR
jgi:hypothetical protein